MRINTLTAEHVLLYMLADAGFQPPTIPVKEGWKIFQQFLSLPAESTTDLASFQSSWIRENPNEPVYSVMFSRQLTDQGHRHGALTQATALEFLFDRAPRDLPETAVWSSEFERLDDFFDHVEHLRQFDYALDATPTTGDVVFEEV